MKSRGNLPEISYGEGAESGLQSNGWFRGGVMSTAAEGAIYRFDGFVLDLVRGALAAENGKDVPLRHKSFQLLCLLVENAGRLLSREVIKQALWPSLIVSDDSVTQCVRDVRR